MKPFWRRTNEESSVAAGASAATEPPISPTGKAAEGKPMNEFSEQSRIRSELFESFVTRQGATVLPGCYGGDYNGDRLAYMTMSDQRLVLLLGVVVTNQDGGIQLDRLSLGNHLQLSPDWIKVLVFSLSLSEGTRHAASLIEDAQRDGRLITAILLRNPSQQLVILPMDVSGPDA